MKKAILIASLSLIAFYFQQVKADEKVIYGNDDRKDYFEISNEKLKKIADATFSMIAPTNLKKLSADETLITGSTLQDQGICSTERFANQLTAANCSGFLVEKNLLVTAGHCVMSERDCAQFQWVKNFKMTHLDQNNFILTNKDIFKCKKIISRDFNNIDKNDYALIELDRPVIDVKPLKIRKKGKIKAGEQVIVFGHPSGLPLKMAAGAQVRSIEEKYFVANLDTYRGNSGSAVINAKSLTVEGILVRGDEDYEHLAGCLSNHRNSDLEGRGEDVTIITNIKELKTKRKINK